LRRNPKSKMIKRRRKEKGKKKIGLTNKVQK
jgi:hypothetical protein